MAGAQPTATGTDPGPHSRLLPGTRRSDAGEVVRGAPRTPEHGRTWSWLVLGGTLAAGLVGALLVALGVRLGAHGSAGAAALTWLGLGVAVLPAAAVACARDSTGAARWTALATVAVVTVVPVGLRSGAGPTTPGDLMRYAQLSALRRGGPLLAERLPAVVTDQPGVASLTTAVGRVSGLTVWHSALVVLVLAHVTAVIGARTLVRALGLGERVAVLAAILWSVGPGVLVATSRVGGATLGLALLLWALAAVVQAATAATTARRLAWSGTAVGLAAATAVTDIAAAWTLVGLVLLVGAVTIGVTAPPVSGAQVRRAWWPAAVGVLAVTVLWSVVPAGRRVLGDLGGLGAEHHRAWATHAPQATLAVVAAVLGLALAGLGVFRLRPRLGETGPRLGLAVAALFPVSLLGLFAGPTTTLAVVLWPVLAAALAPFVASGALVVWDLGARRTRTAAPDRSVSATLRQLQVQRDTRTAAIPRPQVVRPASARPREGRPGEGRTRDGRTGETRPAEAGRRDRRVPLPLAAGVALTTLALAMLGASAGTAPSAAEPVGATVTTTTMSATEVLTLAERLRALAGPGFRFVASDPQLAAVLTTVADGVAVTDVAPGDVFGRVPTAATASTLRGAEVGWLVDTAGRDDALARAPWLVRIVTSASVTVYRVRPAVPGTSANRPAAKGVVPAVGS